MAEEVSSIGVRLTLDATGFTTPLKEASGALNTFQKQAERAASGVAQTRAGGGAKKGSAGSQAAQNLTGVNVSLEVNAQTLTKLRSEVTKGLGAIPVTITPQFATTGRFSIQNVMGAMLSGQYGMSQQQGRVAASRAIETALGSMPKKASGGPVQANRPIVVGEHRAEVFVPKTAGNIEPSIREFYRKQAQTRQFEMELATLEATQQRRHDQTIRRMAGGPVRPPMGPLQRRLAGLPPLEPPAPTPPPQPAWEPEWMRRARESKLPPKTYRRLGGVVEPPPIDWRTQPNWRTVPRVENVRVSTLVPIRGEDRESHPRYAHDHAYLDNLTEKIRTEGFDETKPVVVHYDPFHHAAFVADGNHRLAAARRLGMETIPTTVTLVQRPQKKFRGRHLPGSSSTFPDETGYVPGSLPPSWVGLRQKGGMVQHAARGTMTGRINRDIVGKPITYMDQPGVPSRYFSLNSGSRQRNPWLEYMTYPRDANRTDTAGAPMLRPDAGLIGPDTAYEPNVTGRQMEHATKMFSLTGGWKQLRRNATGGMVKHAGVGARALRSLLAQGPGGGGTYPVDPAVPVPTSGHALGISAFLPGAQQYHVSPDDPRAFMRAFHAQEKAGAPYVGTWWDPDTNMIDVDPSTVVQDKVGANRVLYASGPVRKGGEKAAYDLDAGDTWYRKRSRAKVTRDAAGLLDIIAGRRKRMAGGPVHAMNGRITRLPNPYTFMGHRITADALRPHVQAYREISERASDRELSVFGGNMWYPGRRRSMLQDADARGWLDRSSFSALRRSAEAVLAVPAQASPGVPDAQAVRWSQSILDAITHIKQPLPGMEEAFARALQQDYGLPVGYGYGNFAKAISTGLGRSWPPSFGKSPKVEPFYHATRGREDALVGDTHHLAAGAFDPDGPAASLSWITRNKQRVGTRPSSERALMMEASRIVQGEYAHVWPTMRRWQAGIWGEHFPVTGQPIEAAYTNLVIPKSMRSSVPTGWKAGAGGLLTPRAEGGFVDKLMGNWSPWMGYQMAQEAMARRSQQDQPQHAQDGAFTRLGHGAYTEPGADWFHYLPDTQRSGTAWRSPASRIHHPSAYQLDEIDKIRHEPIEHGLVMPPNSGDLISRHVIGDAGHVRLGDVERRVGVHNHPYELGSTLGNGLAPMIETVRPSNADVGTLFSGRGYEGWTVTPNSTSIMRTPAWIDNKKLGPSMAATSARLAPQAYLEQAINALEFKGVIQAGEAKDLRLGGTDPGDWQTFLDILNSRYISSNHEIWDKVMASIGSTTGLEYLRLPNQMLRTTSRPKGMDPETWKRFPKMMQKKVFHMAGGGQAGGGLYVVGEIGKELFVPQTMAHLIPKKVMDQIPRAAGGMQVIGQRPNSLFAPPEDGVIIPNRLMDQIPHAQDGVRDAQGRFVAGNPYRFNSEQRAGTVPVNVMNWPANLGGGSGGGGTRVRQGGDPADFQAQHGGTPTEEGSAPSPRTRGGLPLGRADEFSQMRAQLSYAAQMQGGRTPKGMAAVIGAQIFGGRDKSLEQIAGQRRALGGLEQAESDVYKSYPDEVVGEAKFQEYKNALDDLTLARSDERGEAQLTVNTLEDGNPKLADWNKANKEYIKTLQQGSPGLMATARNFGGIMLGVQAYSVAMQGVGAAMAAAMPELEKAADVLLGFSPTAIRTTSALADQTKAMGGNYQAAIAGASAQAGLGASTASWVKDATLASVVAKAAGKNYMEASDLMRSAMGNGGQSGLYEGYGGILGGPLLSGFMGGQAGLLEMLGGNIKASRGETGPNWGKYLGAAGMYGAAGAAMTALPSVGMMAPAGFAVGALVGGAGTLIGDILTGKVGEGEVLNSERGPNETNVQVAANEAMARAAQRTGSALYKLEYRGQAAADAYANADLPQQAKNLGSMGYAFVDSAGKIVDSFDEVNKGAEQLAEGMTIVDPAVWAKTVERGLNAQFQGMDIASLFNRQFTIPLQFAMQRIASPLLKPGTGLIPQGANAQSFLTGSLGMPASNAADISASLKRAGRIQDNLLKQDEKARKDAVALIASQPGMEANIKAAQTSPMGQETDASAATAERSRIVSKEEALAKIKSWSTPSTDKQEKDAAALRAAGFQVFTPTPTTSRSVPYVQAAANIQSWGGTPQSTAPGAPGSPFYGPPAPEQAPGAAEAAEYERLMNSATAASAAMKRLQEHVASFAATANAVQWANTQRLAVRGIADAANYLSGTAKKAKGDLGLVQRQLYDLGRQATRLNLDLQQRQITTQLALANFMAPGETGEERYFKQKEAIASAGIAQQQLDISVQTFNKQKTEWAIIASRSLEDQKKAWNAAKAVHVAQTEAAGHQAEIAALSAKIESKLARASDIYETAAGKYKSTTKVATDAASQFGGVVAGTLAPTKDFSGTMKAAATGMQKFLQAMGFKFEDRNGRTYVTSPTVNGKSGTTSSYANPTSSNDDGRNDGGGATGAIGLTRGTTRAMIGEAGTEAVAILRNPRPFELARGGGGGGPVSVAVNISGVSVRNDGDIHEMARKVANEVERMLARKGQMFGLRGPAV